LHNPTLWSLMHLNHIATRWCQVSSLALSAYVTANKVSVRPMHPGQHQSFNHFMESQRQIATVNPTPPAGPGEFRNDGNAPWERRPRGYSNETRRGPRNNAQYNNYGQQGRSNFHVSDRRMASNNGTPRGSPLRRVSHMGQGSETPIYVHNPQRQSPPYDGDATPRASTRGMMHNGQRIFSDPLTGRTGISSDARLWQGNDRQGPSAKQDTSPSVPFEGHPQARTSWNNSNKPSSTFWYIGEPRAISYESQGTRTLYVGQVTRDDYESHRLKNLMSKFGEVESITFFFASASGGGPAFVA
jgi:hypothetical protein